MRTLVLAILPTGLSFGVLEVTMAAFATRHGSPASAGLLVAAQAAGSLVAGLVYGSRRWPGSLPNRFLLLSGGFALSMLPLLAAGSIPVMFIFMVVAGVFLAPVTAIIYGLIDRVCPPGTLTEAFNWLIAANVFGTSIGSLLAGVVVQNHGIRAALAIAPAGAAVGTLLAAARRRTLRT
jgi:MFS family permease